jgi:hypothetical protein
MAEINGPDYRPVKKCDDAFYAYWPAMFEGA